MNRIGRILSIAVALVALQAALSPAPASAQMKLAFVRPEYVLSQYEPYIAAMKQVQDYEKSETDKLQKRFSDFQGKVDSAQKRFEEVQKQAALMTEEKRNEKAQEFERERTKLAQEQEDLEKARDDLLNRENGRLYRKHQELMQPIFDRLNKVLERVGQEEKYDYIFNVTADTQNILYADKKYDISDKIAEVLKKEPIETPAAAAPAQGSGASSKTAVPKSQGQQKKQ
jgi:outer membrane protein